VEDVLVDRLMANGEGSMEFQAVGDLLGTPLLFQQKNDLIPLLHGMVKATAYASPPGNGLVIGLISTILAIARLLIAIQFSADGTRRTPKHPGDVGLRVATYPEAPARSR
jgi:hypothetical protein